MLAGGDDFIEVNVGDFTTPGGILEIQANLQGFGITVYGDESEDHYVILPDKSTPYTTQKFYGALNPIHGIVKLGGGIVLNQVWIDSYNGGIIESFDCTNGGCSPKFINSFDYITFTNSPQSPSASRLNNITFELDYVADAFCINLKGAKDIYIGGCTFTNKATSLASTKEGRGCGILMDVFQSGSNTISSSVIVSEAGNIFYAADPLKPDCVQPKVSGMTTTIFKSYFSKLSYAIVTQDVFNSTNSSVLEAEKVSISHTDFTKNFNSIRVRTRHADIHKNNLYIWDWSDSGDELWTNFTTSAFDGTEIRMVEIIDADEVLVYDNTFSSGPDSSYFGKRDASLIIENVGLSVGGSAKKVLIRKNIINGDDYNFSNLILADFGVRVSGNLANLEWTCNTFSNNTRDFSYTGSSGPIENPFSTKSPAGNNYSTNSTYKIENLTNTKITYYTTSGIINPVNPSNKFDFLSPLGEPLCELSCDELDDILNKLDPRGIAGFETLEDKNFFNLYPNPTTGRLLVVLPNSLIPNKCVVTLLDVAGREVSSALQFDSNGQIDLNAYQNGVYFLRIQGEFFAINKKIILNK